MESEKTIMIFGAGINQLELIREAKALNLVTVVIDPQEDPPGKAEAKYFYQVDSNDYETTKALAIKHRVNGIVSGQMEKPLRLMAKLAAELGYIFHPVDVTERCLDKWLMKEAFIRHTVSCARGILFKSEDDLNKEKINGLNFPLIIKPRDSFSSRGVYKAESFNEIINFIEKSRSFASRGDIIFEEFLEGREFSVETITWQGETTIIQYTKKFITPYPYTVEMAHLQPADLTDHEKTNLSALVIKGINALGINNSAAHTEIMYTNDGPRIIEIGARLGGDFIASYLTKASTGISMDRAAIQIALGEKPDIQQRCNKYALINYLELREGMRVKKILPCNDLYNIAGVVFLWVFVKINDLILPITQSALRPACFIIEADDLESLEKTRHLCLERFHKKIVLI